MRRRQWLWLLGLVGVAAALSLLLAASMESHGVGSYDQDVILETDRPVRRVVYSACSVSDDIRRQAEDTADPRLFDWTEAELRGGNRFVARLKFTDHDGPLRRYRVFHWPHLVVSVEFEDGSRACRVADLPPGLHGPPVNVRVP